MSDNEGSVYEYRLSIEAGKESLYPFFLKKSMNPVISDLEQTG